MFQGISSHLLSYMATDSSLLSFLGHNKYINAKKQLNTQKKLAYLLLIVLYTLTELGLRPENLRNATASW